MAEINRMLVLAGMNPKRVLISELKAARHELNNAHDQLIRQIETGAQIDEGLFSALKAAVEKARKPAEDLLEAKLDDAVLQQVKDSQEFKDLTAEFKLVSTKRELNNGTLVFDIGVPGVNFRGEEMKGTKYLLKAYADGQLRGVLKGSTEADGSEARHYRIGKKFVSQAGDQVMLYRAMLKDILARGKKKVANQTKMITARNEETFKEYINLYFG